MQLVRRKNGKEIPIATDEELPTATSKRAFFEDAEEEVMRSMARRRKSERPGDVSHACRDCGKEFKRPCDLTKHEKTHSRPWKCSHSDCKYHEFGWPTEKERDRHVNDKHSASPKMYNCEFPPCSYSSKRESNCKQHMEKAHDWQYVRSKSNGRNKSNAAAGPSKRTSSTPLTPLIATPSSNTLSTPAMTHAPSPSVLGYDLGAFGYTPIMGADDYQRRESNTTAGSSMSYSSGYSPYQHDSSFENAVTPDDIGFNHMDVNFNDPTNFDFVTPAFQQPTPAWSTSNDLYDLNAATTLRSTTGSAGTVPHLSPTAQVDVTLFDNTAFDEGFGEGDFRSNDFTLFPTNLSNNIASDTNNLFGDLPTMNMGSHFEYATDNFNDYMPTPFDGHH